MTRPAQRRELAEKAVATKGVSIARVGIGRWITVYNHQRPHTAHGGQPPAVVYFNAIQTDQKVQAVA